MTDEDPEPEPTGWEAEPVDPDIAVEPLPVKAGRSRRQEQAEILAVIAAGGVVGACARYGATLIWPTAPTAFPWTTFWVNVTGCAAMGVLMVLVTERFAAHPLLRPFLATGVLGGYTTFSSVTIDIQRLLDGGRPGTGLLYAAATLAAAVFAVWAAATLTRRIVLPGGTEGGRS